jgi:hypothetical protein
VANDPHAQAALRCYHISCEGTLPLLAQALAQLDQELHQGNHNGPMIQALRTPRP